MEKLNLLVIIISIFLVLSLGVFAKGGSTAAGSPATISYDLPNEIVEDDCEDELVLEKRIHCRLSKNAAEGSNPEACRNIKDPDSCLQLYNDGYPCYSEIGTQKDRCFKRVSGFKGKNLEGESSEALRKYAILLLYDLQEIVEEKHDEGVIETEKAADLIDHIVRMKKVLLQGRSGADAQRMLKDFKVKWKEVLP